MFTLEIDGTALVVTNATEAQAAELFQSEEFKDDLKTLKTDGKPLWNGSAKITVRPANEDEIDAFEEAMSDDGYEDAEAANDDEDEDDEDGIEVVFLIEIDEMDDGNTLSA
jgi:hypothetical protein